MGLGKADEEENRELRTSRLLILQYGVHMAIMLGSDVVHSILYPDYSICEVIPNNRAQIAKATLQSAKKTL